MAAPSLRRAAPRRGPRHPRGRVRAWLDPHQAARFLAANGPRSASSSTIRARAARSGWSCRCRRALRAHRPLRRDRPAAPAGLHLGSAGTDHRLSLVTIHFTPVDGGVRIDLEHEGIPDAERAGRHEAAGPRSCASSRPSNSEPTAKEFAVPDAAPFIDIRFPNESAEYRVARDKLLEAEMALRRQTEAVAAARRALPPGGPVAEDYVFEEGDDARPVRLSELFGGKPVLLLYSYMYGPAMARPCPSCTSILDGLDGQAPHIGQRAAVAAVARSPIARVRASARSAAGGGCGCCRRPATATTRTIAARTRRATQRPILNAFVRARRRRAPRLRYRDRVRARANPARIPSCRRHLADVGHARLLARGPRRRYASQAQLRLRRRHGLFRAILGVQLEETPMADTLIWNFKLLAHHGSTGSAASARACRCSSPRTAGASCGWRMKARRRTSPRSTSPTRRSPKIVARADLPQSHMRSNSLETVGDILAVAYQTKEPGLKPAGFELFDISVPENPKRISLFRLLGPEFARRPPAVVRRRQDHPHERRARPISRPTHPKDDQFYRAIDVQQPVEAGRDRPLVAARHSSEGDNEAPPKRHPEGTDSGFRPHNTNVYPERPGPGLHGLYRRRA